jgi:regulatory protein
MLGRRDLTVAECRARLMERGHGPAEVADAIDRLIETRALDDARVARAHARTGVNVKGRGRLRIARELTARGLDAVVISEALGDALADTDERKLVARAIDKKLRGRRPADRAELARLYQYLMRQGFTQSAVTAAIDRLRRPRPDED